MADFSNIDKLDLSREPKKKTLKQQLSQPAPTVQVPEFAPAPTPAAAPSAVAKPAVPGRKQVKQRATERKLVESITTPKSPEDFETMMQRVAGISANLPPEQKKEIEDRKAKIEEAKEAAKKQFVEDKDTNRWMQVAETLGQALVQLGAGAYGLKHNVDLSGIQFNKADWAQNIEQAERELDRELGLLKEERAEVEREQTQLERRLAEDANFRKRAILQNFMETQRFQRQQQLQAERLASQAKRAKGRGGRGGGARNKEAERQARNQFNNELKREQKKLETMEAALNEAEAARAGEKTTISKGKRREDASLENVARLLGGEQGAELREGVKTPFSFWQPSYWKYSEEDEAARITRGFVENQRKHIEQMKKMAPWLSDEQPAARQPTPAPEPAGPKPGDVMDGYRFKGGDPSDQNNWEQI